MNIFRKSIVAKLWLAMVILVLIIMWITGMVQSNIIKGIYYRQQIDHISRQGYDIANAISSGSNEREKIGLLSGMTNTNIMLVDPDGFVLECHGMGMNMSSMGQISQKFSILDHHGDFFSEEDFKKVLAGETVSKSGINHIINEEVLSVAVPVKNGVEVTGVAIVSHSMNAIEGQMSDFQKVIVNAGIGGIILATFLSLLFSRSLSRPLIQMNSAALAMAGGDYARKVEVKSKDEVGVLANSLNTLSQELQEKMAALERLDQTRRDFVTGVSHELRTPLTIIQGYAEALQDNVADSEVERRECVDGIVEEAGRLSRLVSDLLDLRRIESGQESIDVYQFEAAPVLKRSVDKMKSLAEKKNIGLSLNVADNLPPLRANPDRLEQVMINLIENAVRFTPPGGSVHVGAEPADGFAWISVADSGPGIPEQELDLIWERFYKVDKSRVRIEGGGTGLGLAIVKRLVENMEGSVGVESIPGKGTTFYFTLMLK